MAGKTCKILALHGFHGNAEVMRQQMSEITASCPNDVEFVFVTAPSKPYSPGVQWPRNPWWRANDEGTEARGIEESCLFLRDVLKDNHFDGVFGLSQGAAMAAVLTALLEEPDVLPAFLVDGKPPHPPFKWCVEVSGFIPPGPLVAQVYAHKYVTPTLHVIGRGDCTVPPARTRALAGLSECARTVEHAGGHYIPPGASWVSFFHSFFTAGDPLDKEEVPPPRGAVADKVEFAGQEVRE